MENACRGPAASACDACGSEGEHSAVQAREMMFGLRDRFTYQECGACGHLQLLDVPVDLDRYYAADYYSLGETLATAGDAPSLLTRSGSDLLLGLPPRLLDVLARREPRRSLRWLSCVGISTRSRICDVGCGRGELLLGLWSLGFQDLLGIDPHIEADREIAPAVWVRKAAAECLEGSFDAILLNHSLEHMAAPATVLEGLRACLRPDGGIVVRVPLAGTFAWRHYRADWVGLDPPRHLFVPTERSFCLLAERAGLRVDRVFYDSHAMQFWGSEQYRRDIPLRSERSWGESPERSPFSDGRVARWRWKSRVLNALSCGDSAGFVLRADA
ncbi:MAG: class I SAM-dependent methyltransferase [Solirubrobacteraceae bacterium]